MSKQPKKTCDVCGSQNLKARQKPYPVKLGDKTVEVQRVSVRECMDCFAIKPTQAGQEKIARCMMTFISLLDEK